MTKRVVFTQYLFCTPLSVYAKQGIQLRWNYWTKSATLTACYSQFRNNYFSISDSKNKKIFWFFYQKKLKKIFFLCRTDTVTQYLFCMLLLGCAKKTISLRFIYWAKSATLTAYCSQFRNNYFQKNFYWLCQLGNTQTLLHDTEEENFFTLLKKKLLATLKFFIFFKKENLIYVAFILKICYNYK